MEMFFAPAKRTASSEYIERTMNGRKLASLALTISCLTLVSILLPGEAQARHRFRISVPGIAVSGVRIPAMTLRIRRSARPAGSQPGSTASTARREPGNIQYQAMEQIPAATPADPGGMQQFLRDAGVATAQPLPASPVNRPGYYPSSISRYGNFSQPLPMPVRQPAYRSTAPVYQPQYWQTATQNQVSAATYAPAGQMPAPTGTMPLNRQVAMSAPVHECFSGSSAQKLPASRLLMPASRQAPQTSYPVHR